MLKFQFTAVGMLILLLWACGLARGDESTYPLDQASALKVALPQGWSGQSDGQSPSTILLKAPKGKHVIIQITPMPAGMTDEKLKAAARLMGDHFARTSKEKQTLLEELNGKDLHGYVANFSDATENPGAFRHLTAGVVNCDKTYLAVTVYCDDPAGEEARTAMELFEHFAVVPVGTHASTLPTELRVKSPDESWTLVVPGQWKVSENVKSTDGKARELTAVSEDGQTTLSLFLDPADNPDGDAKAAREFYFQRMSKDRTPMEHLKRAEPGNVATLEYDRGSEGFKLHNVNAYLSHDGIWVDAHLSKAGFNEQTDRAVFDALVRGLRAE
jgi:hypothetical protein